MGRVGDQRGADPSPRLRYLLWDFDHTLACRPGLWSQCLADVASRATGRPHAREQFAPYLSRGFPWHAPQTAHPHLSEAGAWWSNLYPVLAAALVAGAGLPPALAADLAVEVRALYTAPQGWVVYPDTGPALVALSDRGWRHIVLSNHVPELPALVVALGLGSHFERVFTSAALGYEKPHAAAFAAAVAGMPEGSRIVMVGDSYTADFKGAQAAGLEAVLVRSAHPEGEACCQDLHALVATLGAA